MAITKIRAVIGNELVAKSGKSGSVRIPNLGYTLYAFIKKNIGYFI